MEEFELAKRYGLPAISFSAYEPDAAAVRLISKKLATKHCMIPLGVSRRVLTIAVSDPRNVVAIDEVRFLAGFRVELFVATRSGIVEAIHKVYDPAIDYSDALAVCKSLPELPSNRRERECCYYITEPKAVARPKVAARPESCVDWTRLMFRRRKMAPVRLLIFMASVLLMCCGPGDTLLTATTIEGRGSGAHLRRVQYFLKAPDRRR